MVRLSKQFKAEQASSDVRSALATPDQGADSESARKQVNQDIFSRLNRYFNHGNADEAEWLTLPELPTEFEVASIDAVGNRHIREVVLEDNRLTGEYDSTAHYLETQYRLMREDAVSTLREAVEDMVKSPYQTENQSVKKIRIYNRVYITALTTANEGLAHRLEFHTDFAEKKIAWAQSKRLKAGTLIALTPAEPRADLLKSRCLIGIVAGRPLSELGDKLDPTIEVYFADPTVMDFDPQVPYMMIEASNGYFEAVRHTLQALQHMRYERFPLSKYLVGSQKLVDIPDSLKEDPHVDIGAALIGGVEKKVDISSDSNWPEVHHNIDTSASDTLPAALAPGSLATTLDQSQFDAFRQILTKRLAIVQGPPGTGKTHVSVIALKALLANRKPGDPPIIVAAQTNHALDQLLRHIHSFAPSFMRLGGQTQDQSIVEGRTLYKVKKADNNGQRDLRQAKRAARNRLDMIGKEMRELLDPFTTNEPIHPDKFLNEGLINKKQHTSLIEAKSEWMGSNGDGADTPIGRWSEGDVQPFKKLDPERDLSTIAFEDDDEDLYKLKDIELETGVVEDEEKDKLHGYQIELKAGYSGGLVGNTRRLDAILAKYNDLNQVPRRSRAPLYSYLQSKLMDKLTPRLRGLAAKAKSLAHEFKIARAHLDAAYLREAPVLGMTTTGLSKNRGLLSSLSPKIVLIEEAAETQEAYVTAACFETLERLILVGDHKQLQAHCQNQELEKWNLHVSLFERLVQYHQVEYRQLQTQRRMLPEMREVMNVIYEDLNDHPCVNNRENVPGMGGVNSWFMSHLTTEAADEQFSWFNDHEAKLITGFFEYLLHNGTIAKDITILTFYKGQQRQLRKRLRERLPQYAGMFNVSTVDAYQGEENEVIILSLVRNNDRGSVGFLDVVNRVCVAMSRARRGFYIFGNHQLLATECTHWKKMLKIISKRKQLGWYLPLTCARHDKLVKIKTSADWQKNDGGCEQKCVDKLPCGHVCQYYCHPEEHDELPCTASCKEVLACGHQCSARCSDECDCRICAENKAKARRKAFYDTNDDENSKPLENDVSQPNGNPATTSPDDGIRGRFNKERPKTGRLVEPAQGSRGADLVSSRIESLLDLDDSTLDHKVIHPSLSPAKSGGSTSPPLPPSPSFIPPFEGGRSIVDTRKAVGDESFQFRVHNKQEKEAAVTAYREFAQGGVVHDDRRRAKDSTRAAAKAMQKANEIGLDTSGGTTFGGSAQLHLVARHVENLPVKSASPTQAAQRRAGTPAENRASPSQSGLFGPPPAFDPFYDASATRFYDKQDGVQDSWGGVHRAGKSKDKARNTPDPNGQVQGSSFTDSLVQLRGSGGNASPRSSVPQAQPSLIDGVSPPPPEGGRKRFVHTWGPRRLSQAGDQESGNGIGAPKDKGRAIESDTSLGAWQSSKEEEGIKGTTNGDDHDKVCDKNQAKGARGTRSKAYDSMAQPSLLDL